MAETEALLGVNTVLDFDVSDDSMDNEEQQTEKVHAAEVVPAMAQSAFE